MRTIKTIKGLVSELTRREGKRRSVSVAQISEIVAHLSDIVYEDYLYLVRSGQEYGVLSLIHKNGWKRAKRNK